LPGENLAVMFDEIAAGQDPDRYHRKIRDALAILSEEPLARESSHEQSQSLLAELSHFDPARGFCSPQAVLADEAAEDTDVANVIATLGAEGELGLPWIPHNVLDKGVRFLEPDLSGPRLTWILRAFCGAIAGFFLAVLIFGNLLKMLPVPLPAVIVMTALGVAGGLYMPLPRRWRNVTITRRHILLKENRAAEKWTEVTPKDVEWIAGESGFCLDYHHEVFRWKYVRVGTAGAEYCIQSDRHNATIYKSLLAACPGAVGVSYTGAVRVPEPPAGVEEVAWEERSLQLVRQRFRRRSVGLSITAAVLGGAGVVLAVAAVNSGFRPHGRQGTQRLSGNGSSYFACFYAAAR
jgi:hypothetical protein